MLQSIEHELAQLGGRTACIVMRLGVQGPEGIVSLNPEMLFPAASLAKVPILLEVARQVNQGMLSWDMRNTIPDTVRVPSSGVLADLSPSLQPTLYDLAHLMITISDNTAANMLLRLVGMDAVNATMQQLGLQRTRLERYFMDFTARASGLDNWTTAGDMALLFSYFCTELLPERERVLPMLLRQNDTTVLAGYWKEEELFAHKTGALEGILHDAGILYLPQAPDASSSPVPLIIVTLTADQVDVPFTRYILARVGRIIYS